MKYDRNFSLKPASPTPGFREAWILGGDAVINETATFASEGGSHALDIAGGVNGGTNATQPLGKSCDAIYARRSARLRRSHRQSVLHRH